MAHEVKYLFLVNNINIFCYAVSKGVRYYFMYIFLSCMYTRVLANTMRRMGVPQKNLK